MHRLKDIATVQMGLSFRSRLEPEKDGGVAVIQMRDLTESHRLDNSSDLIAIDAKNIHQHHFVKCKDLIFRSRGKTTTTAIINAEIDRAVVAAPLLRIRVTNASVLPEYLCWFINQSSSQAFLHSRATGTAMVMIGKSTLDDLEIPVPDLPNQKKIAVLAGLSDREQALMAKLAKAKAKAIQGILMRLATEFETNPELT